MSSASPTSAKEFDSLDAMMRAYAEQAVHLASADHGMTLDYSPESIAQLETVLAARSPIPEPEQEEATRLWGAYYGEIFRHKFPAEWIMAVYPTPQYAGRAEAGADVAMPALDFAGSQIYPLLKIFRRITIGPTEDLAAFYAKVAAALEAPGKNAQQGRE